MHKNGSWTKIMTGKLKMEEHVFIKAIYVMQTYIDFEKIKKKKKNYSLQKRIRGLLKIDR
jgi:hypothetical protein